MGLHLNFLFWNVGKQNLENEIVALVGSTKTNVLVLAEHVGTENVLLRALHEKGINYFALPIIGCTRIKIFTDVELGCFRPKREGDRYTIWEFYKPGYERLLLAMVHLPSKLHMSEQDQLHGAIVFRQEVELTERETKNTNTIILGDFNMNPFDPGMISAMAMHSIPCLHTAKVGSRVISGIPYSFFYNPTWNLLGDRDGVPGTYYFAPSSYVSYFWNVLDQVVLRPTIADRFDKESLRILTVAGGTNLLNKNGRPSLSDHLPITFSVDLSPGGAHENLMA